MKRRLQERAQQNYDRSVWLGQRYFDLPLAAFVEQVPNFPYIGTDGAPFREIARLERKANELGVLIQATCVGQPLAAACWFEYVDKDLEYAEWENQLTWLLPEIPPHVKTNRDTSIESIQNNLANYSALPADQRARLLRSMERFRASQCRGTPIDRVLDLALAFEIAVSETGDNAPPGWKVSVRSAQLLGGLLADRQGNRAVVSSLYLLRNQATHGSSLKVASKDRTVDQVIQENCRLFVVVMERLLALRAKPDWKSIELEPPAPVSS